MVGSLRHALQESSNNIGRARTSMARTEGKGRFAMEFCAPWTPWNPECPAPPFENFENFPRILDARRITINSRPRSDRCYGCGPFSVCSTGDFGGSSPFCIPACWARPFVKWRNVDCGRSGNAWDKKYAMFVMNINSRLWILIIINCWEYELQIWKKIYFYCIFFILVGFNSIKLLNIIILN